MAERKRKSRKTPRVLVVDVGGSHVKCLVTGETRRRKFKSGPGLEPASMVEQVRRIVRGWRFDRVSIGYPGVVRGGKIVREPHNLGSGWVGFDFEAAFGRPVKLLNDAAMQALGAYRGGTMLFLGLGTGLGSALIVDGEIAPMELGHLACGRDKTYEYFLGEDGRERVGDAQWRRKVREVMKSFRDALLPDYIVLGGGNAKRIERLPAKTRRGSNADAFTGGFRLWDR
jgi:predicted NBD/HSP70 family sugar kinase